MGMEKITFGCLPCKQGFGEIILNNSAYLNLTVEEAPVEEAPATVKVELVVLG